MKNLGSQIYRKTKRPSNKERKRKLANLAVPSGHGFGVVPTVEAVDAVLEFFGNQHLILPATIRIWEAHPLAKVFRFIGGGFATVSCEQHQTKGLVLTFRLVTRVTMFKLKGFQSSMAGPEGVIINRFSP